MNKSVARRLFFLFTQQKVKKGWQMKSYDDEISEVVEPSPVHHEEHCHDEDEDAIPLHPPGKEKFMYIISKGSFVFQSFN
jgi:hypothetical protein